MSKTDSIRMKTLRYHTFNGKPYDEGDVYDVVGDSIQSAHQYAETLKANRMAEDAPHAPVKAEDEKSKEKPKAKPDTSVAPMGTEDLKALAESKTVEHRKQDVPTIKKQK